MCDYFYRICSQNWNCRIPGVQILILEDIFPNNHEINLYFHQDYGEIPNWPYAQPH